MSLSFHQSHLPPFPAVTPASRVGRKEICWFTSQYFWGNIICPLCYILRMLCSLAKSMPNLGQFNSVAQSSPTLWDPMNRSTPGLPVHHQLPKFTQTHVHRVHDAIQPSHPRSFPSPPAPNVSQHQSLFQWVNSSHEVARVLEFQLQHHSLQRNSRADLLQNGLVGSPCSPRDSQESSPTPQFKSIILQCSVFFIVQLLHLEKPYYWVFTTRKTIALTRWTFVGKVMSLILMCCVGWS